MYELLNIDIQIDSMFWVFLWIVFNIPKYLLLLFETKPSTKVFGFYGIIDALPEDQMPPTPNLSH
jgi:hypothetical protein